MTFNKLKTKYYKSMQTVNYLNSFRSVGPMPEKELNHDHNSTHFVIFNYNNTKKVLI